ncbi:MAG TPA: hypothetical protein VGH86_15290 [Phenylobacterium sp.]
MIFHASIPADRPEHVARVIAEIWGGEAFAFPPWPGGYVAMAGDERKSTVEVYPRAHAIAPGDGTDPAQMRLDPAPPPLGCFHLAIATDRSPDEILAIGAREGWRAVRCSRGGFFDVIELWIENGVLIEVLTAEMQRDYKTRISMETWRRPRSTTAATTPA